jgi:hypothetical protein
VRIWTLWKLLLRDVLLTGAGIGLGFQQAYSLHPNNAVLWLAAGFTIPAAAEKLKAILTPPGSGGSSSPSLPPGEPSEPRSSQGAPGE